MRSRLLALLASTAILLSAALSVAASGSTEITRAYVESLPRAGAAYDAVVAAASATIRPDLSNQDSKGNTNALARALMNDKAGVIEDLQAARASLPLVDRTLPLARELQPLPLAAHLTGVTNADVGFDIRQFFLDAINYGPIEGRHADTVRESAAIDPTNWGSHARAAVMWVAWYLADPALVAEAYDNIDRYLSGGAGFTYKADQTSWGVWTIAPAGTTKEGVDLDGAIHDIYRGGTFPTIGPDGQLYVWEASQANISAAIAAEVAGHREVWDEGDRALLRSIHWMYRTEGIGGATGDDRWQPFVFRRAYGSALMVTMPSSPMTVGKGFGFADWLYAAIDGGPTPGSPTSSPALTATPSPEPTAASAEPTPSPAPEPAPSAEPTASPAPEPAPPPSASFTASPTAGTAPLSVSVTDASTGDPTSWLWDYGDGTTTVSGRSPEPHTYSAAGIYTLSLTVANANGSSTASQTISVTSPTSPPSTRIKDITFDPTLTDAVNGVDRISGTVTRDTSTPLAGPGSARIANTAAYVEESFTSTDDLFVTFLLRLPTAPPASARLLMISNGGTVQGNLTLQTNGRLRLRVGSSNIGAESIQLTTGTTWIVGVHQRRGSGKNAVIEAYVAPAGTAFETPFASQTNGTWKAAANRIRLGGTSGSKVNVLLDNALLDGGAMPLTPGT